MLHLVQFGVDGEILGAVRVEIIREHGASFKRRRDRERADARHHVAHNGPRSAQIFPHQTRVFLFQTRVPVHQPEVQLEHCSMLLDLCLKGRIAGDDLKRGHAESVRDCAHLIDDGADARPIFVQKHFSDDRFVRQQLVAQVEMRHVADGLEGAGHLHSRREDLLQDLFGSEVLVVHFHLVRDEGRQPLVLNFGQRFGRQIPLACHRLFQENQSELRIFRIGNHALQPRTV
mmetsp:Transcript_35001/g.58847  ORF Transcript_35001/g.58847 Transcript_35001/m.58847 type:complete len:231 (+) Transcript_35001:623-1315(+)